MRSTKGFRFKCTKCGNCCTDKNTIVNVTYSDILRIKNGLNLMLNEILEILGFYTYDKELAAEDRKKMVIPPIRTEKGLAFVGLLKKDSGACYFYDEKNVKCKIYNLRPNFCRTFPFTFQIFFNKVNRSKAKIKMSYTQKGEQYCPGISADMPLINEEQWIQLGKKTIEDLNDNNIFINNWNDAVRIGKIIPTVKNLLSTIFNLEKKLK
ncbi:MAG: YkgJ family cysteine cluster protein [Promethearchaeota archaeon]|nr:MAG: YkgJ family cysteine cluster protein [Candidatus Lokiarchaeota archaeon]